TLEEITPVQLPFARVALASAFLIAVCLVTGRFGQLVALFRPSPVWKVAVLGTTGFSLSSGLSMLALGYLPAGVNSVLANASPLMVALGLMVVLRERLQWRMLLGLVVGFVGVAVIGLRGGVDASGLNPIGVGVETWLACWSWGAYLGEEALRNGVDVCVASWQRGAPNTFPALAKSAGHYNNSQLIKAEAVLNGFAEGIALGTDGLVSEGSGQNLFLVREGTLVTTPVSGTILSGITRHSIMVLAREMGVPVKEQAIPRETLYTADELFFTGTAAEVTPIRSVDRIPVGAGKAGELTLALQRRFLDIAEGRAEDRHGWLTPVPTT
ncbi:MAG: aminotransferase class IV, partial [Gemmatimonadales bacterium]|nr:aminotransferase class IV [Gemmatimonadales bacterium]